MKKLLCFLLAIVSVFALMLPVCAASSAQEFEVDLSDGASLGFVVNNGEVEYFDLDEPNEAETFYKLYHSPNMLNSNNSARIAGGVMHVGIEMAERGKYRLYYDITGNSLSYASGSMKCKSTAIIFPTTYHDETFSNTSSDTVTISGESSTFDLPSGTTKVKVGWHDVLIRFTGDNGFATPSDKYESVEVG